MTKNFNIRLNKITKHLRLNEISPQTDSDKMIAAYLRTLSDEELEKMAATAESFYVPETFIEGYKNA